MDGSTNPQSYTPNPDVIVIGAGIAGLSATLDLAAQGLRVLLLERHGHVGGKIRTIPSAAGPIDAGPTVLTMRHVFDGLFERAGTRLEDHVQLVRQDVIARHFWPDGSQLDLFDDHDASAAAVYAFAGARAAREFDAFCARAQHLFEAFDGPMMQAPEPNMPALTRHVLAHPTLIPAMAPLSTLAGVLRKSFTDPRLRQLFGRYATYVGGAPTRAPGILGLIWHAEATGVWAVRGGIHELAHAIARLARDRGARIVTNAHVECVYRTADGHHLRLADGQSFTSETLLYAGDPRALSTGRLGPALASVAPKTRKDPRSFSARVHSFAARPRGLSLAHHNVLFDADPTAEFDDLMAGRLPRNPSLYICAMDRGLGPEPPGLERFEIITNAPARPDELEDTETWHPTIMRKMARFGLTFHPMPTPSSVTTETMFAQMFPASRGALYGQSPHGLTASLRRPRARTHLPGLYLCGGGCHPGAGVPMSALSARHAVAAILKDRTSASPLARMATPGGISTA